MAFSQIVVKGTTLTRKSFETPPLEMGILPFWFWNGKLEEDELEWQMQQYYQKGVRGLFIHGRFGLAVPYLSKQWFERVKYVVNKAKSIGLDVWIYDEMNWPSGTAERQVLQKYPHLKQRYLEMVVLDVYGPLFTFLEATDHRYLNTGNAKPIAAYACSAKEYENGIENIIDLTPNLSFEKVIPWEAPKGHWKLLYFLEKRIDYYIDALYPESTQKFIELTHEKYKDSVGMDFGSIVPGFYTDEPAMHYYHVGMDNYVIPWSKNMFKLFHEKRGYDLRPLLPALFAPMGDRTAEIRYDFWRTLTERYSESYFKPIQEWCHQNKVIFTGHLLGEDRFRMHARCEGNIFSHLKYFDITGVDHLYPIVGGEENPDEHVALKLASSAAHHYGSDRLLCESMGGTYWDCTLERMKWIANWEYALGVTIFNNHGYHYTIEGERKRDWPPSQFYHHSWWEHYPHFTTYMARLGHLLSGGKHVAKLLMLYPINSIWSTYVPQQRDRIGDVIEQDFYYLTDMLLRCHFDYDYIDETLLEQAEIIDGKISIAKETYEVFVLPPVTHIKNSVLQKLQQFVQQGGTLIASTLIPQHLLEATDEAVDVEKFFGISPQQVSDHFFKEKDFSIHQKQGGEKVYTLLGPGLNRVRPQKDIVDLMRQSFTPDVIIDHEKVFYLHRQKDGYDLFFLANISQENLGKVRVSFEKPARPELWDPSTGRMQPVTVYTVNNGRLEIELEFCQAGSYFIMLTDPIKTPYISSSEAHIESFQDGKIKGFFGEKQSKATLQIETENGPVKKNVENDQILTAIKPDQPFRYDLSNENVLCIKQWKMSVEPAGTPYQVDLDDSDWLDVNMGAWEMQLPQEREEESYPVTLWYRAKFEIGELPERLSLLIDGFSGSEFDLYINGKQTDTEGERCWFDAEIKQVDILSQARTGENLIAVRLNVNRRTDGLLDMIKLAGPFALDKTRTGFKIVHPRDSINSGDWTRQGYPCFSGTVTYRTEIDVPEAYCKGNLFLKLECGEDVARVSINNNSPVVFPWHPYEMDISRWIKPGKNRIEIAVTNTMINMLEAVQKPSGLLQEPELIYRQPFTVTL